MLEWQGLFPQGPAPDEHPVCTLRSESHVKMSLIHFGSIVAMQIGQLGFKSGDQFEVKNLGLDWSCPTEPKRLF